MDKMLLNKNDGTTEEIEIVMTFKLKEIGNDDYVFYKDAANNYYAAKFFEENDMSRLDTNLTDDEKKVLSEVFESLREGEIIQC